MNVHFWSGILSGRLFPCGILSRGIKSGIRMKHSFILQTNTLQMRQCVHTASCLHRYAESTLFTRRAPHVELSTCIQTLSMFNFWIHVQRIRFSTPGRGGM